MTKLNFSALFSEVWVQALTPKNVISGFQTTGVYPPDRNAIKLPGEEVPNLSTTKTGITYIPLYTPAKRRISDRVYSCAKFTNEEHEDFQRVYDSSSETDNPKYQSWLSMYHPDSLLSDSPLPRSYQPALKQSSLAQFLDCPLIHQSSVLWCPAKALCVFSLVQKTSRELREKKTEEKEGL